MKPFAKSLYNAINKQVNIVKDSYVATAVVGGTAATLYMAASFKQHSLGNRKAMVAMATYAGYALHLTGVVMLEKYQRDNRKAVVMLKEVADELDRIDADAELFDAEIEARTVETYKGYRVVVWDDFAAYRVQIPASLPFAIACIYDKQVILLSQAAYETDRADLEAIFEHEIGHMALGHSVDSKDAMTMEYEADAYAHSQGYDIVKTLRQLRRDVFIANLKYGKSIGYGTINDRIKAAQRLG